MTTPVLAVVAAVVAALLGWLSPRLVAALPEPEHDESLPEEDPKPLYVDLAARPGANALLARSSAVLAAVVALVVGDDLWLVALVPLVPVCVLLAWIDWHTRLLPWRIVLPATAYALLVALVLWPVTGSYDDVLRGVVSMVATWGVYAAFWFIYPAGLGYGDVRLAALIGIVLGYVGWSELLVGVYAGFLVFGLPSLVVALVRRDRKLLKTAYPFGPFMLTGALLGLLLGPAVAGYLGWG